MSDNKQTIAEQNAKELKEIFDEGRKGLRDLKELNDSIDKIHDNSIDSYFHSYGKQGYKVVLKQKDGSLLEVTTTVKFAARDGIKWR